MYCRAMSFKNKKGETLLKKNGKPQMLPAYSYLVDASIAKERNKKAVEVRAMSLNGAAPMSLRKSS